MDKLNVTLKVLQTHFFLSILSSQYYIFSHNKQCDIIHKTCGFEGDISENQPKVERKPWRVMSPVAEGIR